MTENGDVPAGRRERPPFTMSGDPLPSRMTQLRGRIGSLGGSMSEHLIFAKCAWRLTPFMMVLYLVNYINRVSVGFAALTMTPDIPDG